MKVTIDPKDLKLDEAQKKLFTSQKKEITRLKNIVKRRDDKIAELERKREIEKREFKEAIETFQRLKKELKYIFNFMDEDEVYEKYHRYC